MSAFPANLVEGAAMGLASRRRAPWRRWLRSWNFFPYKFDVVAISAVIPGDLLGPGMTGTRFQTALVFRCGEPLPSAAGGAAVATAQTSASRLRRGASSRHDDVRPTTVGPNASVPPRQSRPVVAVSQITSISPGARCLPQDAGAS
jgi:hypothetical protein